jgi:hypothetical protein
LLAHNIFLALLDVLPEHDWRATPIQDTDQVILSNMVAWDAEPPSSCSYHSSIQNRSMRSQTEVGYKWITLVMDEISQVHCPR